MSIENEESFKSGIVTLVGYSNGGRSSLLNRLIGAKISIVSPKLHTTRNRIVGIHTTKNAQCLFVDTPCLDKPHDQFQKLLYHTTIATLPDSDVLCIVVSVQTPADDTLSGLFDIVNAFQRQCILVVNKIDTCSKMKLLPLLDRFSSYEFLKAIIPVSALTNENIDHLRDECIALLPQGPQYFEDGRITEQSDQFLAAERIREVIINSMEAEIPYSIAITIDEFLPAEERSIRTISATIFVEKDSQKPIMIGKEGNNIKKIGSLARKELELYFDEPLMLNLWVKVEPRWRNNPKMLNLLGFS